MDKNGDSIMILDIDVDFSGNELAPMRQKVRNMYYHVLHPLLTRWTRLLHCGIARSDTPESEAAVDPYAALWTFPAIVLAAMLIAWAAECGQFSAPLLFVRGGLLCLNRDIPEKFMKGSKS